MTIINDETFRQLKEIQIDYMELVKILHEEIGNIPENTRNKIWDLIYKRFEP